jgi:hypothetical protein
VSHPAVQKQTSPFLVLVISYIHLPQQVHFLFPDLVGLIIRLLAAEAEAEAALIPVLDAEMVVEVAVSVLQEQSIYQKTQQLLLVGKAQQV